MNTLRAALSLISFLPAILLLGVSTPGPVSAQTGVITETNCRCVDADGNEIENCRCIRAFSSGDFSWNFSSSGTSRARIGVTLSMSLGKTDSKGARIESVLEDGPADQAGIQEGDIVTGINGRSLFDPLDDPKAEGSLDLDGSLPTQRLLELAQALEPGDEVEIDYLRDGNPRSATLEAEDLSDWGGNVMIFGDDFEGNWSAKEFQDHYTEMAEDFKNQNWNEYSFRSPGAGGEVVVWSDEDQPNFFIKGLEGDEAKGLYFSPEEGAYKVASGNYFRSDGYFRSCPTSEEQRNFVFLGTDCLGGIRTEEMNPALGEYFGTDAGVLVADVHEDSPLGLKAGDVILRVGDREAADPGRLRKIFRSYDAEEEVTLHIMRKKQSMTVTGTLGGP